MGWKSLFSIEYFGGLAILVGFLGGFYDAGDDFFEDPPMKAGCIDMVKQVIGVAGGCSVGVIGGNQEVGHFQGWEGHAQAAISLLVHSHSGYPQVYLYPEVRAFVLGLKGKGPCIERRFHGVSNMTAITPA
jgi:hypothetical protein